MEIYQRISCSTNTLKQNLSVVIQRMRLSNAYLRRGTAHFNGFLFNLLACRYPATIKPDTENFLSQPPTRVLSFLIYRKWKEQKLTSGDDAYN